MRQMKHAFSLPLRRDQQSPSVQKWLYAHVWEEADPNDRIQVVRYQAEGGATLYLLLLPQDIQVEKIDDLLATKILMHRFHWAESLAERFSYEQGQLLLFTMEDGTQMYYCQPINVDMAMISFDFSPK
jgi:hypothetical protein